ncbi:hypothetical protein Acr_00g0073380 [Actinidia rufa]|uniref:Uncharacterized protein n=1 Tax=Actinidia rufa TaxID=165716 RepID=A0A7J0DSK3_9ERIC|nr:hypothetical protein Acr_00g0073380 [Actinidia rufa]
MLVFTKTPLGLGVDGAQLPSNGQQRLKFLGNGTHVLGNGKPWHKIGSHGSNFWQWHTIARPGHGQSNFCNGNGTHFLNFSAMGSHGTHLPGHGSDFSAMAAMAQISGQWPHNFSAMGSHGTHLPGHGSDFSAMGSHGTHLPGHGSQFLGKWAAMAQNFWQWPHNFGNGQPWHTFARPWLKISRQWAAMASNFWAWPHNFSAMGSHGSNFWAMASQFLGNGQPWHTFARPWLKFLGNGQPWHTFARPWLKFLGNGQAWHTYARPWHSFFWAISRQWHSFLGNGQPWPQFCRQWLTISRQWPAMAHNCPAMAQISRQWAAMAQISGQWLTISRQWAAMAQISGQWPHNFSAMGSHGTHLPGHGSNFSAMGKPWHTFARPWLRFLGNGQPLAHIFSAMAFIFLGNGLPWLKFLGNGSHFLGNDQLWHTFAQPWPNSLGNGRPRLRFGHWHSFPRQWAAMGQHLFVDGTHFLKNGAAMVHICPTMGMHCQVVGTQSSSNGQPCQEVGTQYDQQWPNFIKSMAQLPSHGAALACRWHTIAQPWGCIGTSLAHNCLPMGSLGKSLPRICPAMGQHWKVLGTCFPSNGQPSRWHTIT